MKTLHLSIITGTGIAITISMAFILAIMPSSLADNADLAVGGTKSVYGVGEPVSFFVEIKNQLQDSIFPTAVIVNEQNQTVWSDNDLPPNGYKGTTKEYYMQEDSEGVPIINNTGKYKLIVTYGNKMAIEDLTITELVNENNMLHFYGSYKGIDNESAAVKIANQTYYLTTIHKTPSDMVSPNDNAVKFHGIVFTIPGCGMCLPVPTVENPPYYIHVQFPDQTNETLEIRANMWSTISPPMDFHEYFSNGTKIFPNGTKSTWISRLHKDQIVTVFSNHKNPQAGITVTHDSVKFLASVENNSNVGTDMIESPLKQFKSGVQAKNVICRDDLQLLIENHENFPICVRLSTVPNLLHQDWSYPSNCKYDQSPFTAGVGGIIVIEKNASNQSSDKSYSPRNSTVVIGWNNTVSWINLDVTAHSVTSNWNLFDSGPILPGADWQHDFECAGNYGYHSEPHPWMKGWIRVLPPSR